MLIGNLTRDPELRYTPSGVAVCTFGLATNRQWTDSDGNTQESTEFHRLVAWGKLAEICSQLLFKGRKVFAEGRLQTREWTGQDGTKRITTEIVIDSMLVLDSKMRGERVSGEAMAEPVPVSAPSPVPTAAPMKTDDGDKKKKKKKATSDDKPADEKEKEEKKTEEKAAEQTKVKPEDIPF